MKYVITLHTAMSTACPWRAEERRGDIATDLDGSDETVDVGNVVTRA